jgi:hypothetical protein
MFDLDASGAAGSAGAAVTSACGIVWLWVAGAFSGAARASPANVTEMSSKMMNRSDCLCIMNGVYPPCCRLFRIYCNIIKVLKNILDASHEALCYYNDEVFVKEI